VGGVSWYEASAYAEFAGKALPAIAQWFLAAPGPVAKYIMPLGNFTDSPAQVAKYAGVGPWATYDMAGNVAEWIFLGKSALMSIIGAPSADKRAVLFDTAHDVSEQRADLYGSRWLVG
jgi:hypothetical protein